MSAVISNVVHDLDTPKAGFLALWRLLPERLEEKFGGWMIRLPADTRLPDHTLPSRKRSPAIEGVETCGWLRQFPSPHLPLIAAPRGGASAPPRCDPAPPNRGI